MTQNFKQLFWASLTLIACSNEEKVVVQEPVASAKVSFAKENIETKANRTRYVALGDSFTAGSSDGTIFEAGQKASYANIIAQQLSESKLIEEKFTNPPVSTFVKDDKYLIVEPFNNLGYPGAKIGDLTKHILENAKAQNPSYFSLWIGGNDFLGNALYGAPLSVATAASLKDNYNKLILGLAINGAKGVVASLPYVYELPFFKQVKYNSLILTQKEADDLNKRDDIIKHNKNLDNASTLLQEEKQARKIIFVKGANGFLMSDEDLKPNLLLGLDIYRQARSTDFVLMGAIGIQSYQSLMKESPAVLGDGLVLSEAEAAEIKKQTDICNKFVKDLADRENLAFADTNKYVKNNPDVFNYFSTDGIHPGPKGHILFANVFIDAINAKYSLKIKKVK